MTDDREIYMSSGMSGYVGKPFTSQELWRCLTRFFKPLGWRTEEESQHERLEKDLRQMLINSFVKNNLTRFEEISDALGSGNIELAHRMVHTLKSNAGQLGKVKLQEAAEDIEIALADGVNLATPLQLAALKWEMDAVLAELSPLVCEPDQELPGELKDLKIEWELFGRLEPMLEDGDTDCLKLLSELRTVEGTGAIIKLMEDLDFDAALVALNDLKEDYDRRRE
jgi:HPt (histidine-containing phosphotransfer) domain-containing protein